jgi:hypothetical protein
VKAIDAMAKNIPDYERRCNFIGSDPMHTHKTKEKHRVKSSTYEEPAQRAQETAPFRCSLRQFDPFPGSPDCAAGRTRPP